MSQIEGDEEIKKRQSLVEKFCKLILKEDEYPEFALDDFDPVYDVCHKVYDKMGDEEADRYLSDKISKAYGFEVTEEELGLDFWTLLDYLEREQERQKTQKLLPKPD